MTSKPPANRSTSGLGPLLARAAVPLAAFALACLLHLAGPTFADGDDWRRMQLYFKIHYADALLDGRLPLWTPAVSLGRPFLADVETATLYPPNLLFLAGPGFGAFLSLVLHLGLALAGGLLLGRSLGLGRAASWFGALVFATGAPLLGRLQAGQFQVVCALCWLPLLFWCAHRLHAAPGRRTAAALAATLALLFLAGSPPMFWIGAWAAATWLTLLALASRPAPRALGATLRWGALAAGVAALLVAAQALPFLELVGQGNRSAGEAAFALRHGMEPSGWTALWRSRDPRAFFYWEYNLYAGFLVVPLALLAFRRPFAPAGLAFLGLIVLFALLALGARGPLLPWLVEHVPGWGAFRLPSRYALVVAFGAAWLAAFGLDHLLHACRARPPRLAPALIGLVFAANLGSVALAHHARAGAYAGQPHAWRDASLADELRERGRLTPDLPPPRVLAPFWIVRENSGLVHGFSSATGFANPVLDRVWTRLHAAIGQPPDGNDPVHLPPRLYTLPAERLADLALDVHWDPFTETFARATLPPARAWLAAPARAEPDAAAPDSLRLLDPPPASQLATGLRFTAHAPERIALAADAPLPADAVLVLSEPWYPGWSVGADGRTLPVIVIDGWMRGALLPAGTREIVFTYKSRWLATGALLSMAGLAWLVFLARPIRPSQASSSA